MKLRWGVLVVSFLLSVVRADTYPNEDLFLTVPGAIAITPSDEDPVLEKIPESLQKLLPRYDWGEPDGSVPKKLHGFVRDLSKDAKNVYFIVNPVMSGTGGTGYVVFCKMPSGWREIGQLQGPLYLYTNPKETWPMLVCIGRGGPGYWVKSFLTFSRGKYRETAIQNYDRGIITWVTPQAD